MRAAPLLLAALLLAVAGLSRAGTLYSVVTEFSKNETETIQYTVAANVNSGKFSNVVKNFVIAGSSLTFDGISTFDDKHGVYYYAPDWPAPFVFAADVNKGQLNAPLYMGGTSVVRVDFDDATDTLYTLITSTKKDKVSGYLIATGPEGTAQAVLKFPPEFNFNTLLATEVYNNQYWMVAQVNLNNATSYALASFNLSDPDSAPVVVPITGCHNGFVGFVVYDQSENTFFAVAETSRGSALDYFLWSITPGGVCTPTKMAIPNGIATCFTYDQTGNVVWLGLAPNGPAYFIGYNVTVPALFKQIMIQGNVVPSSIEYSSH